MRSIRVLPLLALFPLLGCDGAADWLRGPAVTAAYAAPLASDTTVVTTRRVWSRGPNTGSTISLDMGMIMPDGAGMAVTDWQTLDPAVFDLASQELRRVRVNDEQSGTGVTLSPLASPDGSQIAFLWMNRLEPEDHLRLVDVATGAPRTLLKRTRDTTDIGQPYPVAWTPAGDSVFAWLSDQDGDAEIVLIPAAGGTPRSVHAIRGRAVAGTMPRMSLSPDGRWLLYAHERARAQQSRSDIYIIDVQGGGARPLVEHPAVDLLVGWLPGTDVVLFSSDRSGTTDLWSVRVVNGRASGEPRLVRSGFFRSEAVGFGGEALFYKVTTGTRGPAIVNLNPQSGSLLGPASIPLAHLSTTPRGLAWSPNGQALAALTRERGAPTITIHSMETGESRVFWLDEGVHPYTVQWAADGQALFLIAGETWLATNSPTVFLRLDLVTGTTTRVFAAADPGEPNPFSHLFRVTPDGRSVVLLRQRALDDDRTEMKIVLRSLEDGSERTLHRTFGVIPDFSLSEDGTQVAFVQQAWEHSDSLFVTSMDGSQPVRAVAAWAPDEVTLLGWLPGGKALLAARFIEEGKAQEIRRVEEILRVELGGSTTVVGISPFRPERGQRVPGAYRSRLVLSPAGNRLVHHVSDLGEELWRMDGLHELFAADPDGDK